MEEQHKYHYYKIKLVAEVSGFTLQETYNFAQYLQYKLSGQQAVAKRERLR